MVQVLKLSEISSFMLQWQICIFKTLTFKPIFIPNLFQEYNFKEVRDREYLITVHRNAKKLDLDISKYNRLRDAIAQSEYDLQRLRDPLQLHLPLQHLLKYKKPITPPQ